MTTNWLTPREARAWRGYLRMRALLDLQISRDLARDSGLSDSDYQVLATLSESEGARLRMMDLGTRTLWSKSRLSHHLDRMAARGLVRREPHPEHTRGTVIVLTDEGLRTIRAAAAEHVDSVRSHFIDLLTEDQIEALGDATETVVEHLSELIEPTPGGPGRAGGQRGEGG